MGFNRRKMEDQRRQVAEKEAAVRRATDVQVREDAERLIAAWNERQASRMPMRPPVPKIADPFAAVIFCTADAEEVDFKMRSKWARVMRYAAVYKDLDEPLADFIKRRGGINKCATRYTRRLGRGSYTGD
jgi:hypothetical protein